MDAPVLIALWQSVAFVHPFALGRPLGEAEIAWAIQAGMGPLLHAATREAPERVPEALAPRLEGADRWARVQSADALDAAAEIIDRCADRASPLTLLKGISICGQYYPSPHQRFLGDLDLLVEPEDVPAVTGALDELGYQPPEAAPVRDYTAHHHLRPVLHPRTKVCVELHTGLFPPSQGLDRGPFSPAALRGERRPSTLDGRPVFRLSPELQIPYIASHWALDFVPAAGARALLDMVLLLRGEADRLDWARLLGWLEDPRIAAHLQLMLSYLEARELVELPPELRADWRRVAVLNPLALRILTGMVDRYQVRGLMQRVPSIARSGLRESPSGVAARGRFRSRLGTLREAVASGNFRGLLLILDTITWERFLVRPRSAWNLLLVPWCLLFPPGDPDRFLPGHQLRRLGGVLSGLAHRCSTGW